MNLYVALIVLDTRIQEMYLHFHDKELEANKMNNRIGLLVINWGSINVNGWPYKSAITFLLLIITFKYTFNYEVTPDKRWVLIFCLFLSAPNILHHTILNDYIFGACHTENVIDVMQIPT